MKILNLSDNKISYFEGMQHGSVSLIEINLSKNSLELVSFADQASNNLQGMLQLKALNLQRNQISQLVTQNIPNTALKSLDIGYNKIDDLSSI